MAKPKRGRQPGPLVGKKPKRVKAERHADVYEADDPKPEEERYAGQRYDRVDSYEYELPSDFEDEEIDEDEAFNSEDERIYGHIFENSKDLSGSEEEEVVSEEDGEEGEYSEGDGEGASGEEEEGHGERWEAGQYVRIGAKAPGGQRRGKGAAESGDDDLSEDGGDSLREGDEDSDGEEEEEEGGGGGGGGRGGGAAMQGCWRRYGRRDWRAGPSRSRASLSCQRRRLNPSSIFILRPPLLVCPIILPPPRHPAGVRNLGQVLVGREEVMVAGDNEGGFKGSNVDDRWYEEAGRGAVVGVVVREVDLGRQRVQEVRDLVIGRSRGMRTWGRGGWLVERRSGFGGAAGAGSKGGRLGGKSKQTWDRSGLIGGIKSGFGAALGSGSKNLVIGGKRKRTGGGGEEEGKLTVEEKCWLGWGTERTN
eukprot:jgi/Botrbrau1/13984/Bobra.117_2s0014.1